MIRAFVCIMMMGAASMAVAQSTEKPQEKPSTAAAATTAPSPAKSRIMNMNNDVRRDELTKKLECRKNELHQCQHKNKAPGDSPRTEARKKD